MHILTHFYSLIYSIEGDSDTYDRRISSGNNPGAVRFLTQFFSYRDKDRGNQHGKFPCQQTQHKAVIY